MQEGLPNSTGSCAFAQEWKISKALHNKKNNINFTFSGNGNVNRPFSYCIDQAGLGAFTAKSGRKHYNPPPLTVM